MLCLRLLGVVYFVGGLLAFFDCVWLALLVCVCCYFFDVVRHASDLYVCGFLDTNVRAGHLGLILRDNFVIVMG